MTAADLDDAVEEESLLTSAQAKECGCIDDIMRWPDLKNSLEAGGYTIVEANALKRNRWAREEKWGKPPRIMIVYADGEVVLDAGMHARDLADHLQELADRRDVRALVVRV